MKQRAENLFKILDDAPLQDNLDDVDQTFLTLKHQIQVIFERFIFLINHFLIF
jgi:hypothetical protein